MNAANTILQHLLLCSLFVEVVPAQKFVRFTPAASQAQVQLTKQDGQHDFDFEIGNWKTHVKRLVHPLTGSTTWAEYDGTSVVSKIWNGRANLVELEVDGPSGHLEASVSTFVQSAIASVEP